MNIEFLKQLTRHRSEAQDMILRNVNDKELDQYETLYQEIFQEPTFKINRWCGDCVGRAVQRVWEWVRLKESEGLIVNYEWVEPTIEEPVKEEPTKKKK